MKQYRQGSAVLRSAMGLTGAGGQTLDDLAMKIMYFQLFSSMPCSHLLIGR